MEIDGLVMISGWGFESCRQSVNGCKMASKAVKQKDGILRKDKHTVVANDRNRATVFSNT